MKEEYRSFMEREAANIVDACTRVAYLSERTTDDAELKKILLDEFQVALLDLLRACSKFKVIEQ